MHIVYSAKESVHCGVAMQTKCSFFRCKYDDDDDDDLI